MRALPSVTCNDERPWKWTLNCVTNIHPFWPVYKCLFHWAILAAHSSAFVAHITTSLFSPHCCCCPQIERNVERGWWLNVPIYYLNCWRAAPSELTVVQFWYSTKVREPVMEIRQRFSTKSHRLSRVEIYPWWRRSVVPPFFLDRLRREIIKETR